MSYVTILNQDPLDPDAGSLLTELQAHVHGFYLAFKKDLC